jgi:hypothetical protein
MCFHAVAHASEKKSAADAYARRLAAIVDRLIDSELSKHQELLNAVSMKLRYNVDRTGRVQNVDILSAEPDLRGAKTVARLLKAMAFPPFPKELLQEGADRIEGHLNWTRSGQDPKNSSYYRYNLRVHKMLEDDVIPAFSTPSHRLEVDYEFYLDARGRVVSLATHAKTGGQWAEQITARSIRGLKFPPVPAQVFEELKQKPPLRIFGTMTWDPR